MNEHPASGHEESAIAAPESWGLVAFLCTFFGGMAILLLSRAVLYLAHLPGATQKTAGSYLLWIFFTADAVAFVGGITFDLVREARWRRHSRPAEQKSQTIDQPVMS